MPSSPAVAPEIASMPTAFSSTLTGLLSPERSQQPDLIFPALLLHAMHKPAGLHFFSRKQNCSHALCPS